jgi:(R,R)-butanediol dehydrogenase / meso-butanediol dehydrogenase / diacetyl reductase
MGSVQIRLYAEEKPVAGIAHPGPHQVYRHPFVRLEKSTLGPLKEEDIRVEMLYAGICGTDIHLTEKNRDTGYIKSSAPLSIPANQGRRIGHEGVGRVMETGRMVRHIRAGSYVTFESIIVCHYYPVPKVLPYILAI